MSAAVKQGAELIVRLNPCSVVLGDAAGAPLELCAALQRQHTETIRTLGVTLRSTGGQHEVRGWVHADRLHAEHANRARHKCRQGHKKGTPKAESLFLAGWVLVFTTLSPAVLSAQTIMALYRCRWHVEIAIKRWKSVLDVDALRAGIHLRRDTMCHNSFRPLTPWPPVMGIPDILSKENRIRTVPL